MSVFDSDGEYAEAAERAPKQCRRDYEADIKRIRDSKKSGEEFLAAIYKYVSENGSNRRGQFTLPELIGRLEMDLRKADNVIAGLIREQEREKE